MIAQEYLNLLCHLIGNKAITSNVSNVNANVDTMNSFLLSHGVKTKIEELDGRKILYAATTDTRTPDILLCVHLDVVPADDSLFQPKIINGKLYGRGGADCLGNAVTAAEIIVESNNRRSIGCIFSTDEETGGATTKKMVSIGYLQKKAALVLDAWNDNKICYAHKGTCSVRLIAHGTGGHSSTPWKFDNPISKLCIAYANFAKEWVNPINADDWRCSMAPCVFNGGAVFNQIPAKAEMVINFRPVGDEMSRIINFFKNTGLEVDVLSDFKPFNSREDKEILNALRKSYGKFLSHTPEMSRMCGATDARHLQKNNVPIYIFGVEGYNMHEDGEFLVLDSMTKIRNVVTEFADSIINTK